MKIITKETGYHIIPSNHEISMVRKTKKYVEFAILSQFISKC